MSAFDADALERAAKAARELEKSRFASQALEISKREQEVKRVEAQRETERARAQARPCRAPGPTRS
jgi:ATPase family AAA domain-containing protein 3A/B